MTYLAAKNTLRSAGISLRTLTEREHRNLERAATRDSQVEQLLETWA